MHKAWVAALLLVASCCVHATTNDIILLDGDSTYDISCTDLSHAICVDSNCPTDPLVIATQGTDSVCLEFGNFTCVQEGVFSDQLFSLVTTFRVQFHDETPLTSADGRYFYNDGYPELELDEYFRRLRFLVDSEDLELLTDCNLPPLASIFNLDLEYVDNFAPAKTLPTFSNILAFADLLGTDAAKSFDAPIIPILLPDSDVFVDNAAIALSRMPVKYVVIDQQAPYTENVDLFGGLPHLYQTYGILVVVLDGLLDLYQPDANAALQYTLSGSSNVGVYMSPATDYGPFCGANNMHSLVSNLTVDSSDLSDVALLLSSTPNVMPNCNWTQQTSMRVFGSLFFSLNDVEDISFAAKHPGFGSFPDIEIFSLYLVDITGSFEMDTSFASNANLKEMILNFYFPYFRTFHSAFWTGNLNSLVTLELRGYAGIILGDLLDYGQNLRTLTIDKAHIQFHNSSSGTKLQLLPSLQFYMRVQCVDAFTIVHNVICLPADLFADPANYTNPEFSAVLDTVTQYNFSDVYLALHQQYIPTVSDVATVYDARGAALLAHVQLMLTRCFADVDLIGGFAAFNESTMFALVLASSSLSLPFPAFNVRTVNIDANTDNVGGTLFSSLGFNDWGGPYGGVFVNITVSTPIEFADASVGGLNAFADGFSIHGPTSLCTNATVLGELTSFFAYAKGGKTPSRLKLFELHNQVYDSTYWSTATVGNHPSLITLILDNVTIPDLNNYIDSVSNVLFLRSVIITNLHSMPVTFPDNLVGYSPALQTLILRNSNVTGSVGVGLNIASSLTNFDVSDNPLLTGTLSDTFLARHFTSVFDIHNTGLAINATTDMPLCRSEPGFTCVLSLASTIGPGCSCTHL